jgi:hypothetical protein
MIKNMIITSLEKEFACSSNEELLTGNKLKYPDGK